MTYWWNSMTTVIFQAWKIPFLNSKTFQDAWEPRNKFMVDIIMLQLSPSDDYHVGSRWNYSASVHALAVVIASCSITGSLAASSDSESDGDVSVCDFSAVSLVSAAAGFSFSFCHDTRQSV